MSKLLHIKPTTSYTKQLYSGHSHYNPDDSGLDLYIPKNIDIYPGETKFIDLEIQCEMVEGDQCKNLPYYIYTRSSISKTPLILSNNVGIIGKDI